MSDINKKYLDQRHQFKHRLQDGGIIVHVPMYVKNANDLFKELVSNVEWSIFKYNVYDRIVDSPRLMSLIRWDDNHQIFDKLPKLCYIKLYIEELTGVRFSYAVLNYYRDGKDYISYHSDREVSDGQIVASVSLGATRRFILKNKKMGILNTLSIWDTVILSFSIPLQSIRSINIRFPKWLMLELE